MSVVISDALARDLLWWLQNIPLPNQERSWRDWYRKHHPSQMEIARDSMVEELSGAMGHPDAMKDDFDATLDKQLSDMAIACGPVYIKAKKSPPKCPENQGIESEKGKTSHHVVLTIDQAKELALKLKNNAEFFFFQTGEFDYDTDELWQCLTEKIEQAEMSIAST